MPPSTVAKASGIRTILGDRPASSDDRMATGIMIESAATLFMKAESAPPTRLSAPIWTVVLAERRPIARASRSSAPDEIRARVTTKTAATLMVAASLKPLKAWSMGTRPATVAANRAAKATRS
jgi:hypothetical protein